MLTLIRALLRMISHSAEWMKPHAAHVGGQATVAPALSSPRPSGA